MLRSPRAGRDGDEAGFTLLELMVTGIVVVIVLAIAGAGLVNLNSASGRATSTATSASAISAAMTLLGQDLRSTHNLTAASASGFTAIVNQVGGTTETVTWAASGGVLTRTVGSGTAQTVVGGLTNNSVFSYYFGAISPLDLLPISNAPTLVSCTTLIDVSLQASTQTGVPAYTDEAAIALTDQTETLTNEGDSPTCG